MTRTLKFLLPSLVFGVLALALLALQFTRSMQRETARTAAQTYSKTITKVRDHYTARMRETVDGWSEAVGHGPSDGPPTAYAILSDVSETMPEIDGGRFRVVSEFPWPGRDLGGPQDDFERSLLERIIGQGEDEVVVERDGVEGKTLVYAEPVVMGEGCVQCHNTRSDSPKRGWAVGDVRGVQFAEVQLPTVPWVPTRGLGSGLVMLSVLMGIVLIGFWTMGARVRAMSIKGEKLQLMQQVVHTLGDGVVCLDGDGVIREFNPAAEAMFGYSRDEVLGKSSGILMREQDRDGHLAGVARLAGSRGHGESRERRNNHVIARSRSGEEIPVSMDVVVIGEADSPQLVGTLRDLRAGMKHQRIAGFLEATLESIDQGVTIYDEDLRLVAWNRRYEEMDTGVNPKFLAYGASLFELYRECAREGIFGPGDPDEIAQRHIDAIQGGEMIESEILTPGSGSLIQIHRFRLSNGGICATFRDITESRRVEEDLRQAQKMEAVGRLAGGVAHDLNNLLTVMMGNTELLLTDIPEGEDAEILQGVLDAAHRGADVTHRLLAFSRKQPLQPGTIEVAPLFDSLQFLLSRTLGEQIHLECKVTEGVWSCIADRAQLESTLVNLAANARDALEEGGSATLVAKNVSLDGAGASQLEVEEGDYLCLSMTDTGSGMSSETLEQAFDPFFTTKPPGKGTGLGLSTAHGFVKQSKGAIAIESDTSGTTVSIYLPRSMEPSGSVLRAVEPEAVPVATGSKRILVIEDEEQVRQLVTEQLEQLGFDSIVAANGEEALRHLESSQHIDLVLADLVLPGGLGGWELGEIAQRLRPGIPTVFMSGYSEDALGKKGQINASTIFLRKPFSMRQLEGVLRRGLGSLTPEGVTTG